MDELKVGIPVVLIKVWVDDVAQAKEALVPYSEDQQFMMEAAMRIKDATLRRIYLHLTSLLEPIPRPSSTTAPD